MPDIRFDLLPDDKLLLLLQQDNRMAFDCIYNRYWEKMFLYVVKVIQNSEEARDIVQEVFISLWSRRYEAAAIDSLSAWLFAAARYKSLGFIQSSAKKNHHIESLAEFLSQPDDSLNEQQSAGELMTFINSEIKKLPSRMQEVFVLSRTKNLSHKEISEKLNISDKTVKKQISYAIKQLRLSMEKNRLLSLLILFLCRSLF